MAQERAGRVLHLTGAGELVLESPPDLRAKEALGAFLVDARFDTVARVTDVIGPVASPFLVAAPKPGSSPHRLVGRDLYLSQPRPRSHARASRSNPRRSRGVR